MRGKCSKKRITSFQKKVYKAVSRIPRGKVSTYAAVACAIGRPRAARAVGSALNKNPFKKIPCHRVVKSDGSVGGFARGAKCKIEILESEGVLIKKGKVCSDCIVFL